MKLMQLQKMVQDQQQQMAAMGLDIKYGMSKEGVRQEGETRRELIKGIAKAHNTETIAEVKVNDQNTRSITSQNKTEIEAIVKLLLANMSPGDLVQKIDQMNAEQYAFSEVAAQDIHQGSSPFIGQMDMASGLGGQMPQQQPQMQPQMAPEQPMGMPQ
jgi:hypothetical protein